MLGSGKRNPIEAKFSLRIETVKELKIIDIKSQKKQLKKSQAKRININIIILPTTSHNYKVHNKSLSPTSKSPKMT